MVAYGEPKEEQESWITSSCRLHSAPGATFDTPGLSDGNTIGGLICGSALYLELPECEDQVGGKFSGDARRFIFLSNRGLCFNFAVSHVSVFCAIRFIYLVVGHWFNVLLMHAIVVFNACFQC